MIDPDTQLLELLLTQDARRRLTEHGLTVSAKFAAIAPGVSIDAARAALYNDLHQRPGPQGESSDLSLLGRLSAEILHEVRNMTNTLQGFAKIARRSIDRPERLRDLLTTIEKQAASCAELSSSFLLLAQDAPHVSLQVNELVTQAISLVRYSFRSHDIVLTVELTGEEPMIAGNHNDLLRVLVNLLRNAQEAIEREGQVGVSTHVAGEHVEIHVTDSGPGIPADLRERVFDSLFTTKGDKRGTGLGLALSARAVAASGGSIHVDDAPSGGARFVLRFPVRLESACA